MGRKADDEEEAPSSIAAPTTATAGLVDEASGLTGTSALILSTRTRYSKHTLLLPRHSCILKPV